LGLSLARETSGASPKLRTSGGRGWLPGATGTLEGRASAQ